MPYLVLDIETVTDSQLWTPPAPEVVVEPTCTCGPRAENTAHKRGCPTTKKPRKPKKAPEDIVAPHYAHRPVAIAWVGFTDDWQINTAGVIGASTYGDDERKMLTDFGAFIGGVQQPTIVTFGGRRFDAHVLQLRAFRHGIPQSWYSKDMRHRYGDAHIDVMDVLTDYGNFSGYSLDTMCRVVGLPEKSIKGSEVAGLFRAGHHSKVEGHCLCDAVKTAFLFLRLMLVRGRITPEAYRTTAEQLLTWSTQTQLTEVVFKADPIRLLLT